MCIQQYVYVSYYSYLSSLSDDPQLPLGRVVELQSLRLPLDQVVPHLRLLPLHPDQAVLLLPRPLPLVGQESLLLPLGFLGLPLSQEVCLPLQERLVDSSSLARLDSRIRKSINLMFR